MFRKQNFGRDEKTVNGFSRSLSSFLSKKRQAVAGSVSVCTYIHTRARWLRSFAFCCLIRKNSFFLFFLSFIYFLSFCLFFSVKVSSFLFLFLKKKQVQVITYSYY